MVTATVEVAKEHNNNNNNNNVDDDVNTTDADSSCSSRRRRPPPSSRNNSKSRPPLPPPPPPPPLPTTPPRGNHCPIARRRRVQTRSRPSSSHVERTETHVTAADDGDDVDYDGGRSDKVMLPSRIQPVGWLTDLAAKRDDGGGNNIVISTLYYRIP